MSLPRTLAPTAPPMRAGDLLRGVAGLFSGAKRVEVLMDDIKAEFGVRHAFALGSGKAALTVILEALGTLSDRTCVIIPAYTCFSVPAAIRKAGLSVVPCDVDPHTFDFNPQALKRAIGKDTLCIVPSNLFGIPSDVQMIRGAIGRKKIFIVEDAAQAMGIHSDGQWVGTRGDVGFFSLGRGKQISCGAGGIIVTDHDQVAAAIDSRVQALPASGWLFGVRTLLEVAATMVLIRPLVFGIPARLPFLALGQTHYHDDFPVQRLSGAQAGLLSCWQARLHESLQSRARAVAQYRRELPGHVAVPDLPLLRLPLLAPDRQTRERICTEAQACGLGIGGFYPSAVGRVPQVAAHLRHSGQTADCPVADDIADRLLTVPTHYLLKSGDRDRIVRFLKRFFDGDT